MTNADSTQAQEQDPISELLEPLYFHLIVEAESADAARSNLFRLKRWATKTEAAASFLWAKHNQEGAA